VRGKKPTSTEEEAPNFVEQINKTFGPGTIVRASDKHWVREVTRISTGSLALDVALGGGYPRGRMTQLYGKESSAKSTLALLACKEAQKLGERCMLIVVEADFDPSWAERQGVDLDLLDLGFPETSNAAADILESTVRTDSYGVVVFDSIAAGATAHEIERSATQDERGTGARLINKMLRKTTSALNARPKGRPNQTAVILVNQLRSSIGIYATDFRPGGRGLDYFPSIHIKLGWTRSEEIKEDDDVFAAIGSRKGDDGKRDEEVPVARDVKFLVEKNKTYRQGLSGMFRFYYVNDAEDRPLGIDFGEETLRLSAAAGLIERSGAWTKFPDGEKAQGEEAAITWLYKHPAVTQELRKKALAFFLDQHRKPLSGRAAAPADEPEAAAEAATDGPLEPLKPRPDVTPAGEMLLEAALADGTVARLGPAWLQFVPTGSKMRKKDMIAYLESANAGSAVDRQLDQSSVPDGSAAAAEEKPRKRRGRPPKNRR